MSLNHMNAEKPSSLLCGYSTLSNMCTSMYQTSSKWSNISRIWSPLSYVNVLLFPQLKLFFAEFVSINSEVQKTWEGKR